MTARLLSHRMGRMFALAMAFGVVSVPLGLSLAFAFDLPTGTAVAATTMAILFLVLLGRSLASAAGRRWPPTLLAVGALLLGSHTPALATTQEEAIEKLRQEMKSLTATVNELQQQVQSQAETIRQQEKTIRELRPPPERATAPPPPAPAPPPAPERAGVLRQLGGLVFNPEMRVEGTSSTTNPGGMQDGSARRNWTDSMRTGSASRRSSWGSVPRSIPLHDWRQSSPAATSSPWVRTATRPRSKPT